MEAASFQKDRIIRDGQGFHEFKRQSNPYSFPHDFAHYLSSMGDVYFWPKGNFHVVTRAGLAKKALLQSEVSSDRQSFFVSRMPHLDLNLIQDFFAIVSQMMVMKDGREHQKCRSIGNFGLNDQLIDHYAAKIPGLVEELLHPFLQSSLIDFAQDFANKLPSMVLAELFCIPKEDRTAFYQWSNTMTGFFGGGSGYTDKEGREVNKAALSLKHYFRELLKTRRSDGVRDFFSGMLLVAEKYNLSEDELIAQAVMMLVAGQVTTGDQMNNIMFQLLYSPEILSRVLSDLSLVEKMIEEGKRLDPAVTFIFRVAKDNFFIGDQFIAASDNIFISTHGINRDPDLFSNPHEMDLTRSSCPHFAYGYGPHYCLGARLARIEIQTVFSYLLTRFPNLHLAEKPIERDHYSLSFSGFRSLVLKF
jgi:cytochrome P450